MHENEIAKQVVDVAYRIHTMLGPGLLQSVYKNIMPYELTKRGCLVEKEEPIPLRWENIVFDEGFRADLLIERKLVVELKSIEHTLPIHKKVLLTYLRLANCKLGLLINFGEEKIKDGISRVVNGLEDQAMQD